MRWRVVLLAAVAGVVLLGWTGSAGEGTDLVGHLSGFIVGVVLGAAVAVPRAQSQVNRVPQWLTGAAALASIALAWACALRA